MGVGHFFRYIAERYPLICQEVSKPLSDIESAYSEFFPDASLPFDALYLDMNGIIHICAYSSKELSYGISSLADIWVSIFQYITKIVNIVKPQKLLYLAVDGVAPKAKMNQQRVRRFRSVADSERRLKMNKECGEMLDGGYDDPVQGKDGFVFDPTCVTPGTEFMHEFTKQIEQFVAKMLSCDRAWSGLKVVVSGANAPGEGEHKIAEYVRNTKGQGILSHCVYGLDADLIMLSLLFHEPNVCLLRESVIFPKMKGNIQHRLMLRDDSFVLLHIRVLRDYLARDLLPVRMLREPQISRAIDDFILICMLIGNDFLPHLKFLQIPSGGLTTLIGLYRQHVRGNPENPWLMIGGGEVNLSNLRAFLESYVRAEEKMILAKLREERQMTLIDVEKCKIKTDRTNYSRIFPRPAATVEQWASRYYYSKMGFWDEAPRLEVSRQYLVGMQWVLYYYYTGVPDWEWYLRCPYPPLARDLCKLLAQALPLGPSMSEALGIRFSLGQPCTPFEQLLSVLPAKSSYLLPAQLAVAPGDSRLAQLYPENFDVDMDDTLVPWGGVALLPTVDPGLLRGVIEQLLSAHPLSAYDRARNSFGQSHLYFVERCPELSTTVTRAGDVALSSEAAVTRAGGYAGRVKRVGFKNPPAKGNHHNTMRKTLRNQDRDFWFPGLGQIRHSLYYRVGVNVFTRPSQHESLYLHLHSAVRGNFSQFALVGYPYPVLAQVAAVYTPSLTFYVGRNEFHPTDPKLYENLISKLRFEYHLKGVHLESAPSDRQRRGRRAGEIPRGGFASKDYKEKISAGESYQGEIFSKFNDLSAESALLSYQKLDKNLVPYGPTEYCSLALATFIERPRSGPRDPASLNGCDVVCLAPGPLFGALGTLDLGQSIKRKPLVSALQGNLAVDWAKKHYKLQALALELLITSKNSKWYSFETLCSKAKVSPPAGQAIITSLQLDVDGIRHDVGMGLVALDPSNSKILFLPGYSNAGAIGASGNWCHNCLYSYDALNALQEYKRLFPQLFNCLEKNCLEKKPGTAHLNAMHVFQTSKEHAVHMAKNLVSWCGEQPFKMLKFVAGGYSALSSDTITKLAKLHDLFLRQPRSDLPGYTLPVFIASDPSLVYSTKFEKFPSFESFKILERCQRHAPVIGQYVVNLYDGGPIPVGARAIITGVFPDENATLLELCLLDVCFGASSPAGRLPRLRGVLTSPNCVLSLPPLVTWGSPLPSIEDYLRFQLYDPLETGCQPNQPSTCKHPSSA